MDFDFDIVEIFEIFAVGFPRRIYERPDLFHHRYDKMEFFKRLRLSKQSIFNFLPNIEADLEQVRYFIRHLKLSLIIVV